MGLTGHRPKVGLPAFDPAFSRDTMAGIHRLFPWGELGMLLASRIVSLVGGVGFFVATPTTAKIRARNTSSMAMPWPAGPRFHKYLEPVSETWL